MGMHLLRPLSAAGPISGSAGISVFGSSRLTTSGTSTLRLLKVDWAEAALPGTTASLQELFCASVVSGSFLLLSLRYWHNRQAAMARAIHRPYRENDIILGKVQRSAGRGANALRVFPLRTGRCPP